MISKRSSPLNINIFGEHSDEFIRHQTTLNDHGYNLEPQSDIEQIFAQPSSSDISIISASLLEDLNNAELAEQISPFLVYDFREHCNFGKDHSLAHKAVGHFIDKPSPKEISLKIEVGLLLYQERRTVGKRLVDLDKKFEANRDIGVATGVVVALCGLTVQESYELLRRVGRNQRCRISDVAKSLVSNSSQLSEKRQHDLPSIEYWLEENVLADLSRN